MDTMKKLLNANADKYAELENWDSSYPEAYSTDINLEDSLGNPSQVRQDLYNPLYYLLESYYDGAGTSTPAKNWRIRMGICQGDTANTTDINLALALKSAVGEKQVDFETVWGQGHTMAERTGSSTENFVAWVKNCCK